MVIFIITGRLVVMLSLSVKKKSPLTGVAKGLEMVESKEKPRLVGRR